MARWIRYWEVESSNPLSETKTWRVSQAQDGSFGCSCPAWKFAKAPKPDCKHIRFIRTKLRPENVGNENFYRQVPIQNLPIVQTQQRMRPLTDQEKKRVDRILLGIAEERAIDTKAPAPPDNNNDAKPKFVRKFKFDEEE